MKHSGSSSSLQGSKWVPFSFLFIGLLGLLDASYLVAEHYLGIPLVCGVGHGCSTVLNSTYSLVLGIPIALLGVLYYFSVVVLSAAFLDTKKIILLKLVALASVFGFAASLVFTGLQAFVIKEFCLYCLGSAALSTLLFILSVYLFITHKFNEDNKSIGRTTDI